MYKPITMVLMGLTRYKAMIENVIFNSVMGILTRVCLCAGADPGGAHPARAPPKIGEI